jgi:Sulfotransferase family
MDAKLSVADPTDLPESSVLGPRFGWLDTPVPDPLFILAPPRSFTSVVSAMLGQHPQMYALLETSLFCAETLSEWLVMCERAKFPMADGLLRCIAQLIFGEQTESNVREAQGWLRRRGHCTTGYIFEMLAESVVPKLLIEKSPSTVYRIESLRRTHDMFPNARYLHLARHPRAHGESVMNHIRREEKEGAIPAWLINLASFWDAREVSVNEQIGPLDPQHGWLVLHRNIVEFLNTVPEGRKRRIRGEDLLSAPDRTLQEILEWLGLTAEKAVLEQMKHPERWLYAKFGPRNARYGTDRFFLERPMLRPDRVESLTLEGPLSWRADGGGFLPEVGRLAVDFGYS